MEHTENVVTLSFLTCFHIDLPLPNNRDCSPLNSSICVECDSVTKFITGENLTETDGVSSSISLGIWLFTVLVGLFGFINNIVIILVVTRRTVKRKKFDFLITYLAVFDLITCIGSIFTTSAAVLYLHGWIKLGTLFSWYFIWVSSIMVFFSRSLSYFMTVIINTYCYTGLAHPLRSKKWFSWSTVKMLPFLAILMATAVNIPRAGSVSIIENVYNEKGFDIPSLHGLEYIAVQNKAWWKFWYENDGTGQDCSDTNPSMCIKCITKSIRFFNGEPITETKGWGHFISYWIWLAILAIGLFGALANLFIVIVMKSKSNKFQKLKGFDYLMTSLAIFDVLCSITSILAATSIIFIFEGWISRGSKSTLYFYYISNLGLMFTRSLSTHMAVHINLFCYLGLAYPLHSRKWFTKKIIKIMPFIVMITAVFLSIPRFIPAYLGNNLHHDVPSLTGFEYVLYVRQSWMILWYKTLGAPNEQLDVPIPLLILLVFNFLSYRKMIQLKRSRQILTSTQEKAVQPLRMFLPVVTVLLLSNLGPIAENAFVLTKRVMYRELTLAVNLSHGVNCSVNFLIYYWRSENFRNEAKKAFNTLLG
ncbi:unnamed protein product [Orchesella dallaii]|uniref:G-protein coupled receptors family 1 profile domain-containing protein n=1 Tax=Orchesella dallaii TaxID=48710 RepID=A0ABP1QG17_9HEXA